MEEVNDISFDKVLQDGIRRVAVLVEHPYALYSVIELIELAKSKDIEVILIGRKHIIEYYDQNEFAKVDRFIFIEQYHSKLGKRLTELFELLFVGHNFSETYSSRKAKKWQPFKLWLSENVFVLKITRVKLNNIYATVFRLFTRLRLTKVLPIKNADLVVSLTKENNPYLLAPWSAKHVSIMESWDHPMKEPYFINPFLHLTWNKALAKETEEFQNLKQVAVLNEIPKFRYIRELSSSSSTLISSIQDAELREELLDFKDKDYCVYPMCTSSDYYGFKGEIDFLRDLARELCKQDIILYVRPYPLAPREDTDILNAISGVHVGKLLSIEKGFDVLNRDVQIQKYYLIRQAKAVINIGTTFALDAALISCPVLQLKLLNDDFGSFSQYSRGGHIKKYLWIDASISYEKGQELPINRLVNAHGIPYSKALMKWLRGV